MDALVTSQPGLTSEEVRDRVAAGHVNAVRSRTSRPVSEILRSNILTWFNLILGVLCVVMLAFGSWRDALFGFVLVFNTIIGIAQELRAKFTLDRLSLISQPAARVVRDGAVRDVAVTEIVLDEVVVVSAGEQIVVDGTVLESDGLEVDESALTGESLPASKRAGDSLLSGSFVTAGLGAFRATAVGADSYAMRIEARGRQYARTRSDIMDGINTILRAIGVLMIPVGAVTIWSHAGGGESLSEKVTAVVASLVAMVPEGLVLLSSIAFAASALVLARHRVLVNQLPAVEGLARTDVVCADKTGTLTEPTPGFSGFELATESPASERTAIEALGALAGNDPSPNATVRAIGAAVPDPAGWTARRSEPFSSARKWSGADFGAHGTWVLGAPDVVLQSSAHPDDTSNRVAELAAQRLRVLVLASTGSALSDAALPSGLRAVGLVILAERLRPDSAQTMRYLSDEGVAVKILSGDDPATVSAVAAAAGVPDADKCVDARTLGDETALAQAMEHATIFGRVMPEQKSAMVSALQRAGHVVSMTGDGVNDVLALKQADLGIAMGSGVPATKAVADLVLLDNRFASFPLVVSEGRRVVANAERVANLFLTKSAWAAILAVAVFALQIPYPLLPRQITLAGSLAIGIPAFFLALSQNPTRYRPGFLARVLRFAVPAGAVIAVAAIAAFVAASRAGLSLEGARTITTAVLTLASLGVICAIEWPLGGWRLAIVAAMAIGLGLVFAVPLAREFFALVPLSAPQALASVGTSAVTVAAIFAIRRITRVR